MSEKQIKNMIANTFLDIADALETGSFGKKDSTSIITPLSKGVLLSKKEYWNTTL